MGLQAVQHIDLAICASGSQCYIIFLPIIHVSYVTVFIQYKRFIRKRWCRCRKWEVFPQWHVSESFVLHPPHPPRPVNAKTLPNTIPIWEYRPVVVVVVDRTTATTMDKTGDTRSMPILCRVGIPPRHHSDCASVRGCASRIRRRPMPVTPYMMPTIARSRHNHSVAFFPSSTSTKKSWYTPTC